MSGILICTSIVNGSISEPTKEVLGMGRQIAEKTGGPVSAALLGAQVPLLTQELISSGADQVYVCEDEKLTDFHANLYLKVIEDIIKQAEPDIVIFPGESAGT